MKEWSVATAIEIAKVVFSGGDSGPADPALGAKYGAAMGAYIKALAEELDALSDMVDK